MAFGIAHHFDFKTRTPVYEHFLGPEQLHLTNPCPPDFDSNRTAYLREINWSLLKSDMEYKACPHTSNGFFVYLFCKIPFFITLLV